MALQVHDPRQVEKTRKHEPLTESYWQRGCNDAKAGRPYTPPTRRGEHDRQNTGYANGYDYGHAARAAPSMDDHSFDVTWRFAVPPGNSMRVVITQRRDGAFRRDEVGGRGHYYVSREVLTDKWEHVNGSACGGYSSYGMAHRVAEGLWTVASTSAGSGGVAGTPKGLTE
jgi:hypothetical protein